MHCADCPYKRSATIEPTGPKDAKLIIIGEAPGSQELVKGVPFVGPSGALLRRALRTVGYKQQPYLTNALLCKPDNAPLERDIKSCSSRLFKELYELEPIDFRVILLLGNAAVQAVTPELGEHISSIHGMTYLGLPEFADAIVPTFHPAYILRNPDSYKSFLNDVRYACYASETGELKDTPLSPDDLNMWSDSDYKAQAIPKLDRIKYWVIDTPSKLRRAVRLMRASGECGIDIEATGLDRLDDRIIDIGISYRKNRALIFPRSSIPQLAPLLEDGSISWIWHHGKFDTTFLMNAGVKAPIDDDVMLMHYTLDEGSDNDTTINVSEIDKRQSGAHGLKLLAQQYLGAYDYSISFAQLSRKYGGIDAIPKDIIYPYLAKDAIYTLRLAHRLRYDLDRDQRSKWLYRKILLPGARFLQRVERRGIHVDVEQLQQFQTELEADLKKLEDKIKAFGNAHFNPRLYCKITGAKAEPKEFNPASPKQLSYLIYKVLQLRPRGDVPAKQRESTNKEILKLLPPHEFITDLLEYRRISKEKSTYVDSLLTAVKPNRRVYTTFNQHKTITGRLSSSDPNVENQPRSSRSSIKKVYTAPDDRLLLEADYSQAELRSLGVLSQDEFLAEVYRNDRDLHDEVAKVLFGENFDNEQRTRAKNTNFGIAYGLTAKSLARREGIALEEAARIIRDWFARAPKAEKFINECRKAPMTTGILHTPFGRSMRFPLVTPQNIEHLQNRACNFPIQSVATELLLISAMELDQELELEYDAWIVNLVHDSMVIELPNNQDIVRRVAERCLEKMLEVPKRMLGDFLPFKVDVKVGKSWHEMEKLKVA